jgi:hypothetical protein
MVGLRATSDVQISEDVDIERIRLINLTNLAGHCAHVMLSGLITVLRGIRT